MNLFKIGASWGGFESLIIQSHINKNLRKFKPDISEGHLIRLYTGFEDINDLKDDIKKMLSKL